MKRCKTVDDYVSAALEWQDELSKLRKTLLATELEETVKWGAPCYTFSGKNVVGIGAFKSYCGLWFFQGGLLKDNAGVLINAQEGKTKALRQWRFRSAKEIKTRLIQSYVKESIAIQQEGREIRAVRGVPVVVPSELEQAFEENKTAGSAFRGLTPGRQREYASYVADAKRHETKQKRISKITPMILAGGGLNDKYRDC